MTLQAGCICVQQTRPSAEGGSDSLELVRAPNRTQPEEAQQVPI